MNLGVGYGELEEVLIVDVNADGYSDIVRNGWNGLLELAIATPATGQNTLCTYSGFTQLSIHPSSENTDPDTRKWAAMYFGAGHFYNDSTDTQDGKDLLYRVDESLDQWWVAESRFLESYQLHWRKMNDFASGEYPDTPMIWDDSGFFSREDLLIGWFTTPTGTNTDEDFDDVVTTLRSVKQGGI